VALVLAADAAGALAAGHAWLYAEPASLALGDVPALLQAYKDAVLRAEAVCRAADARAVAWGRGGRVEAAAGGAAAGGAGAVEELASVSPEEAATAVEAIEAAAVKQPPLEALALGENGAGAVTPAPAPAAPVPERREETPSLI
jgi:hypothetical protein